MPEPDIVRGKTLRDMSREELDELYGVLLGEQAGMAGHEPQAKAVDLELQAIEEEMESRQ